MNEKEKKLASEFLELASDKFSNHGCNDVEESFWEGWTLEDRQQFVKEYHEWNGDPESYDPERLNLPDHSIMSFLANKITNKTWNKEEG
jgi:hypothetical protein